MSFFSPCSANRKIQFSAKLTQEGTLTVAQNEQISSKVASFIRTNFNTVRQELQNTLFRLSHEKLHTAVLRCVRLFLLNPFQFLLRHFSCSTALSVVFAS